MAFSTLHHRYIFHSFFFFLPNTLLSIHEFSNLYIVITSTMFLLWVQQLEATEKSKNSLHVTQTCILRDMGSELNDRISDTV